MAFPFLPSCFLKFPLSPPILFFFFFFLFFFLLHLLLFCPTEKDRDERKGGKKGEMLRVEKKSGIKSGERRGYREREREGDKGTGDRSAEVVGLNSLLLPQTCIMQPGGACKRVNAGRCQPLNTKIPNHL